MLRAAVPRRTTPSPPLQKQFPSHVPDKQEGPHGQEIRPLQLFFKCPPRPLLLALGLLALPLALEDAQGSPPTEGREAGEAKEVREGRDELHRVGEPVDAEEGFEGGDGAEEDEGRRGGDGDGDREVGDLCGPGDV